MFILCLWQIDDDVCDLVWICRLSLLTEHFREGQGRLQGAIGNAQSAETIQFSICANEFYFCLLVGVRRGRRSCVF